MDTGQFTHTNVRSIIKPTPNTSSVTTNCTLTLFLNVFQPLGNKLTDVSSYPAFVLCVERQSLSQCQKLDNAPFYSIKQISTRQLQTPAVSELAVKTPLSFSIPLSFFIYTHTHTRIGTCVVKQQSTSRPPPHAARQFPNTC